LSTPFPPCRGIFFIFSSLSRPFVYFCPKRPLLKRAKKARGALYLYAPAPVFAPHTQFGHVPKNSTDTPSTAKPHCSPSPPSAGVVTSARTSATLPQHRQRTW